MKEAKFTVPGEPRGKGRPRFATRKTKDGRTFAKAYTPNETVVYENLVRMEYERQCGGIFFPKDTPVEMSITAYYQIPKSVSKKKARMMLEGKIRPLRKPDSTNVQKSIEDGINTVAYHDDAQIVDSQICRYYGEIPRVEVTIREIVQEGENADAQGKADTGNDMRRSGTGEG